MNANELINQRKEERRASIRAYTKACMIYNRNPRNVENQKHLQNAWEQMQNTFDALQAAYRDARNS